MSTGATVVGIDTQILAGTIAVSLTAWTDTTGAGAGAPKRTGCAEAIAVSLTAWTDTTGAGAGAPKRTDDAGAIAVDLARWAGTLIVGAGGRAALFPMGAFTSKTQAFSTSQGKIGPAQAEYPAHDRCREGLECLAARCRGRQGFGELIKTGRFHVPSLLCDADLEYPRIVGMPGAVVGVFALQRVRTPKYAFPREAVRRHHTDD